MFKLFHRVNIKLICLCVCQVLLDMLDMFENKTNDCVVLYMPYIFPFHILPSPVHPTGFSFYILGFLTIFARCCWMCWTCSRTKLVILIYAFIFLSYVYIFKNLLCQVLLDVLDMFENSPDRKLLNQLYIKQFCLLAHSTSQETYQQLATQLQQVNITSIHEGLTMK